MQSLGSGRFELVRRVGEGGAGVVFEARDLHMNCAVAVKLLHGGNEVAEERFEREVAVLAELQHPSIVRYIAHGTADDGRRYLVMEWLAGNTVENHRRGQWPVVEVLSLARRVVSGMAFAALRGVSHRDIKPPNLFLVDDDAENAKILDFGLARRISDRQKVTQTGFIVGTPVYMSPEQARGERTIDARTDVFSMGSVLYTCLCGREPFLAPQPLAILAQICFEEPLPIEERAAHVPARLRTLVQAMMRKDREERPNWRTIAEELAEIADQHIELDADNLTHTDVVNIEASLGVHSLQRGALTMHRRGRTADLRILAAAFIGVLDNPTPELEKQLDVVATEHGARIDRLLDGTRVVLPKQQLDTSEQTVVAARCAISLQRALGGRTAVIVCTGRAALDVKPFGELFERAAGMLADTPPGAVHVDAASAALLETRFELGGREGARRTLERERSGGDAPRTLLGQTSPFVGRERELQQLQLVFGECVEELVARVVLVTAPAGGGKSRLQQELIERLRAAGTAFTLLAGRGDPMRGGTQFGVLAVAVHTWAGIAAIDPIDVKRSKLAERVGGLVPSARAALLTQFLGEMVGVPFPEDASPQLRAARLDHQLMADRMLENWLAYVEALGQRGPLLFCIEDLHWSDPASVRFVEAALRSSRERAVMVLALARPEVRDIFPQLWAERDLMDLRLPKLGARACTKLLEQLAGAPVEQSLQAALIERADGNPFFLEELVRGIKTRPRDEGLPETILAIVQARLDDLGDEPKLLIQAASVFGTTFRVVGLRALIGEENKHFDYDGALALLAHREIILRSGAPGDHEYVFKHSLLREAAYLLQPDDDRALGHRLAAAWLEQNGEGAAVVADHYERGGVRASAGLWWSRAAANAFDVGSLDDALRFGARAISCGLEGEAFGKLTVVLAEARSYSQDDTGATVWAERARLSFPDGSAEWWRATQVCALGYLRRGAPEFDHVAEQIIERCSRDIALPEQAVALAYTIGECLRVMRDDVAERMLALLPAQLPEVLAGRPEGCMAAAHARKAFRSSNFSAALRFAGTALEAQRQAGALRDVCDTLNLTGYLLHELGAYGDSEARIREAVELAVRMGSESDVYYANLNLGSLYARTSRDDDAERALMAAWQGFQKLDRVPFQAEALGHLAYVQCARGELDRARQTATRVLQLELMDPAPQALALARLSAIDLAAGLTADALEHGESAHKLVRAQGITEFFGLVAVSFIASLEAVDEKARAREAREDALRWLEVQAAKIDDPALRQSFLEQVPEHAALRRRA
jgi:hypothetical protein